MDEKNWLIYAPNKGGRADMRLMQASNEPYNHPWEFKHVCRDYREHKIQADNTLIKTAKSIIISYEEKLLYYL
jgi:hypothetical protein